MGQLCARIGVFALMFCLLAGVVAFSGGPPVAAQNDSGVAPGQFEAGDQVMVTSGPVNLRADPARNAPIQDTLEAGTAATVTGGPTTANGLVWYQIDLDPEDTIADGWVVGTSLALASAGGDFAIGDVVFVNNPYVNLRKEAGIDADIITQLPQGTTGVITSGPVDASDDDYEWYELDLDNDSAGDGWVAGEFLALFDDSLVVTPGSLPAGSYVFVNAPRLNLRADATISSADVQTLRDGDMATVLAGPVSADGYN